MMNAIVVKIKNNSKQAAKKPLSPLQKKLLAGLVMADEDNREFKKTNKWLGKWKV